MPRFNEDQKKIALLLLNEPKTEEDMNKQLNIPYDKLTQELKALLKLGVITKEGYPTKYRLKQDIVDKIQQRKKISEQDSFKMRLNAIIEFKAVEKTLLKKHMGEITAALKKEKAFTIYDVREAEIIEESNSNSTSLSKQSQK
mgnify:CR=1 FL=1